MYAADDVWLGGIQTVRGGAHNVPGVDRGPQAETNTGQWAPVRAAKICYLLERPPAGLPKILNYQTVYEIQSLK